MEPLVSRASIVSGVTAVLALLVSFGVDLNADQQTAIMGVVAVVAPLVVAAVTRHRVSPYPATSNIDETPEDAVMH